jgi:hypothetical protein
MAKVVSTLMAGALVGAAALLLASAPAGAHPVPVPCDFITSGGFVFTNTGDRANFGAHGGCKHEDFWGNVNYVDHGGFNGTRPYHVKSIEITGYLFEGPNARDICGIARTNAGETVGFRVRLVDNDEPGTDETPDEFGIELSNGYLVSTRPLAGGNVQLHGDNPSTTGPPDPGEDAMCGDLDLAP